MAFYEITTGYPARRRDLHMVCEVYAPSNNLSWTCILAKLYEHESSLDAGRFANFTRTRQEHVVTLDFTNEAEPWWVAMERKINWIAEVSTGSWSLEAELLSVLQGSFSFGFEDVGTAMMFKLVFA